MYLRPLGLARTRPDPNLEGRHLSAQSINIYKEKKTCAVAFVGLLELEEKVAEGEMCGIHHLSRLSAIGIREQQLPGRV